MNNTRVLNPTVYFALYFNQIAKQLHEKEQMLEARGGYAYHMAKAFGLEFNNANVLRREYTVSEANFGAFNHRYVAVNLAEALGDTGEYDLSPAISVPSLKEVFAQIQQIAQNELDKTGVYLLGFTHDQGQKISPDKTALILQTRYNFVFTDPAKAVDSDNESKYDLYKWHMN